jgi:hypothetical protein
MIQIVMQKILEAKRNNVDDACVNNSTEKEAVISVIETNEKITEHEKLDQNLKKQKRKNEIKYNSSPTKKEKISSSSVKLSSNSAACFPFYRLPTRFIMNLPALAPEFMGLFHYLFCY